MKAVDSQLLNLLKKSSQFVVPIYQRLYSWGTDECSQLWEDITRAGKYEELGAHFTGSIVYVSKGSSTITASEPDLIIDGQQRTTTVSLILAALAKHLETLPEGKQEVLDGFSPSKIRNRYLLDTNEEGDRRFKLLLSASDRQTFNAIVQGHDHLVHGSSRLAANYEWFLGEIASKSANLVEICRGLEKLVVVDVKLERGLDNPQLVFEAMNSTGKKLSQADLIRNFLLMDLSPEVQNSVYEKYWQPTEQLFVGSGEDQFDSFVRHLLTIETGEIPRIGDVYESFKSFAFEKKRVGQGAIEIAEILHRNAVLYSRIALGTEPDTDLRSVFEEIEQIKADVVYPFMLKVYSDYETGVVTKSEFLEISHLVVSYVFRRAVCKIPTNSMNKTFARFASKIQEKQYLKSVKGIFLSLQSYRRFPRDEEFREALKSTDLYNFRRRMYFFRQFENFGRKEKVSVEQYSIEHIMPQNPQLSVAWQNSLGSNWSEIQDRYLHTLGNLTLTGYNSEYSDKPFLEKRDMVEVGFAASPLRLNSGLGQISEWNLEAIVTRASTLAQKGLTIWSSPVLTQEELAQYLDDEVSTSEKYSVDDHPWLTFSPQRVEFYERLHTAILAIDPVIRRQFLKVYVAYKAESNFVDIIPMKSKMCLSINIPLGELIDPKMLARDVSRIGRWGTGVYEVDFDESSDFDYVLGLIRQAFEHQLDLTA